MELQLNNNTMFVAHKKEPVHDYDDLVSSFSSSSSSSSFSSGSSLESDSFEEVTSLSSSPSSPSQLDVSSLFQHLPMKRGLSKFYQGMSQSFTSLASVRSIEDLAKPENPYNKRLKSCRSYGEGLAKCQSAKCTPSTISRHGSKKGLHSRGSCTSKNARRGSGNLMGRGAPVPPPRSTSTSTTTIPDQTALFA